MNQKYHMIMTMTAYMAVQFLSSWYQLFLID